jgi:hypothetical protein
VKSLVIIIFLALSSNACAEELITTVSAGQPAPFAGTLFNTEAAAKLAAELESSQASCQIEIDREVGICKVEKDAAVDEIMASLLGCQERSTIERAELNGQIDILQKEVKHLSRPSRTAMFGTGVAAGITLTLATAYALTAITN